MGGRVRESGRWRKKQLRHWHTLVLVELYAVDAEEGDASPESFANHAAAVQTRKVMAQALLHSGSAKNGLGQL
jgi:hypothetical protein